MLIFCNLAVIRVYVLCHVDYAKIRVYVGYVLYNEPSTFLKARNKSEPFTYIRRIFSFILLPACRTITRVAKFVIHVLPRVDLLHRASDRYKTCTKADDC